MKSKIKILLPALLVMLLWGSLFPMVKLGYNVCGIKSTGDILFFAGIRFTICGAIICIFSFFKDKKSFLPVKSSVIPVMLSGLFAIILHYSFTYLGLKMTDSSKTAILKQIGVLFYVCFSVLFFKNDRLTLKKFIGVMLGFAGIIAINISGGEVRFYFGDVLIVAASFCTVFSNVISKKLFETVEPITATGCSQLFGGIILLIIGKFMGGNIKFDSPDAIAVMIYIFMASILSYCVWFVTVKKGELSKLFIIKFAEPVFASVFGAMLLGENILKWQYGLSFLFIVSGIFISQMKDKDVTETKQIIHR